MRRYLFPVALGVGGVAILIGLGLWQLERLAWKQSVLAAIEAKIGAAPVAFETLDAPEKARDLYRPVSVTGRTTGEELLVLSGQQGVGAGYEVIAAFETASGRRILLDRGFVREAARDAERPSVRLKITGNLHWPDEADAYTPPPDPKTDLWFARDVAAMAGRLGTEPVLIVVRTAEGDMQGVAPVPVDTLNIPNNHLEYAVTWFSLAAIWAGMTAFLLWRIRQRVN